MPLNTDMSIPDRIAMLEDALAQVLNLGPQMSVEPCEPAGERAVYVIDQPYDLSRTKFSLYKIARELEMLL